MQNELLSRIIVEREADWIRVQGNSDAALQSALEARLSALPGGSKGDAARRVRPALEERLKALQARMWEMAKPNLRVNGFNYEDFVESESTQGRSRAHAQQPNPLTSISTAISGLSTPSVSTGRPRWWNVDA